MPSNYTYNTIGEKTIKNKTTGHEKLRFTVVLGSLSAGTKLKPMVIFRKLKKAPKGDFSDRIFVTDSMGGSMNYDLMKQWIDKCYRTGSLDTNLDHRLSQEKTLLVTSSSQTC